MADKLPDLLRETARYSMICDETLYRVCETIAPRYNKKKEAIKAVKAHLHAMCGAFLNESDWQRAVALLNELKTENDESTEKQIIAEILKKHASTAERISLFPIFYSDMFSVLGKPDSIADIACGFNPISIPIMELEAGLKYYAADANLQSVELVSRYFDIKREIVEGHCEPCDVLSRLPSFPHCDIAFIFKLLPLVERQRRGGAKALLDNIDAKTLVVTFPTVTIGGKRKGMTRYYTDFFKNLIGSDYFILYEKEYSTELVFGIRRV